MKKVLIKKWKWVLGFTVAGFAVTALLAAYQVVMQNYSSHNPGIFGWILVSLCPESLICAVMIDLNIGSQDFYFLYFLIGLANAGLYGLNTAMILGIRDSLRDLRAVSS